MASERATELVDGLIGCDLDLSQRAIIIDLVDAAKAEEREACAALAEDENMIVEVRGYDAQLGGARATADKIAAAIRQRSNP